VDCDLYSSAALVLKFVGPRLKAGTYIVFDEFHGYPGASAKGGEWLAWNDYVAAAKQYGGCLSYQIADIGPEQLAVRIL
jgi:hypothetical protein